MNLSQLKIFENLQSILIASIDELSYKLKEGMKEHDVESLLKVGLQNRGLTKFWYPIMISAGENTSRLFSRRVHLPDKTELKKDDIIIIDATPLDASETIWGNWCQSYSIGNEGFYHKLCEDALKLTLELESFAINSSEVIGDIYFYFQKLQKEYSLDLIGENIGHSIFSVKPGQTVEETPKSERVFIDRNHWQNKLSGILSIEPQLKRRNPKDGKYYAAKYQRIVIFD